MNQNERWQWQKVTDGRFFCDSSIIEYLCKRNMNEKEIKKDMATTSEGINMRLFYVRFPKIQTVSGQLTWSHYLELLKCDDPMEMQFYMKECIKEGWKVRELKRQINSSLFQRLALSTDKEGVLALANEGEICQLK